jgi:hypothetical protein
VSQQNLLKEPSPMRIEESYRHDPFMTLPPHEQSTAKHRSIIVDDGLMQV